MKNFVKLGLLTSMLMTVASSAFALSGTSSSLLSTTEVHTVPEPAALTLLGVGIVVLALVRRKK